MKSSGIKNIFSIIIVSLLMICLAFEPGLNAYAEGLQEYVASLKLFIGEEYEDALKDCKNSGYIPFDFDLNDGSDGSVVMGYTKTTDKTKAITDISVLEMNVGYTKKKFKDIAEQQMSKMGDITEGLVYAVTEFKENLEDNSPAAREALATLNLYFIPEMDNMGLGDYLISDSFSENFLKKLICYANSGITYALYSALTTAVADYDGGENWVTRAINGDVRNNLENKDVYKDLDKEYKEKATKLKSFISEYASMYNEAKAYVDKNGYEVFNLKDDSQTEDADLEVSDDTLDKIENYDQEVEDNDKYFLYIVTHELLNEYEWEEGLRFGDYLVSLGEGSYTNVEELRALYPLISGLTEGQYALASVAGLNNTILALNNNTDIEELFNDNLNDIKEDIKAYNNGEALSVWTGVDLTIYEEEVALSSEAQRQMDAGRSLEELTKTDALTTTLSKIMSLAYVVTSITCVAWFVATIAAAAPTFIATGFSAGISACVSTSLVTVCTNALLAGTSSILTSILSVMGAVIGIMQYICLAALIILALIEFVKWIVGLCTSDRAKEALDYTVADIPKTVYDFDGEEYIRYDVVTDKNGSPADLNAFTGLRFAALYTTTEADAGEPIKINDVSGTFKLQNGTSANPAGYLPVSAMGGSTAIDLNFYSDEDDEHLFLYYAKEGAEGVNTSTTEKTSSIEIESTDEYLASIEVSTASTETAAISRLEGRGYTVIYFNLTPDAEKSYSYIGYKTTTNPDSAIKDIRVSPRTDGSTICYGEAKYVLAGESASTGRTLSGLGIYYATADSAGSPIYANLLITKDKNSAPEGWEPVNMFCGGGAYNINDCTDDEQLLCNEDWDNGVYIFFEPEQKFTSGTEYLGGFTVVNTEDSFYEKQNIYEIAEYYGFTVLSDKDLSEGSQVDRYFENAKMDYEQAAFICYSTTYNVYRAIYDIKSYTAAPGTTSLNLFMGSTDTGAYAVCDTVFKFFNNAGITYEKSGDDIVPIYRVYALGVSANHSYLNLGTYAGELEDYFHFGTLEQEPDDFMETDWEYTETPMLKGLYVQGAVSGVLPLKVSDVVVEDKKDEEMNAKGYYSIQDFRTPNRTEAHNIAFSSKYPAVIYVKKTLEEKGTYISSIAVVSWNVETVLGDSYSDYSEKQIKQVNLMADNACISGLTQQITGEILPLNLAINKDETWQADWENEIEEVAYLGVSRTNNSADAITSIIKFMPDDPSAAKNTITVDGVSYTKAGSEAIHASSGDYYIYYSKSSNSGNPGEPITEISFSDTPIIKNAATVLTASNVDVKEQVVGKRGKYKTTYAKLYGNATEVNYIHVEYETTKTYMDCLYVGAGDTENEALAELLSLGCNMIVPIDLNQNAGGKYVYLGYSRFNADEGSFLSVDNDAIKDIICTVGQSAQDSIEYNGLTYQRAFDRYNYNDLAGAVSLNEGTSGRKIYIYYTTEKVKTDESALKSPIMTIGAHTRDFVPDNQGDTVWESVLVTDGTRCNLNDGVFGTGEDGHSLDNRIYLFVNRENNSVKLGGNIAKGNTSSTLKYGTLSFTK